MSAQPPRLHRLPAHRLLPPFAPLRFRRQRVGEGLVLRQHPPGLQQQVGDGGAITTGSVTTAGGKITGTGTGGTLTKTGNYTLLEGDGGTVFADATGGAVTITLPAASSSTIGRVYRVFKVDSSGNAVNIAPNGSNTLLAGSTTNTTSQANCLNVTGYSATAWIVNKTQ